MQGTFRFVILLLVCPWLSGQNNSQNDSNPLDQIKRFTLLIQSNFNQDVNRLDTLYDKLLGEVTANTPTADTLRNYLSTLDNQHLNESLLTELFGVVDVIINQSGRPVTPDFIRGFRDVRQSQGEINKAALALEKVRQPTVEKAWKMLFNEEMPQNPLQSPKMKQGVRNLRQA